MRCYATKKKNYVDPCSSISGAYEILDLSTRDAVTFNQPVNFRRKKIKKEGYLKVKNNNKKTISPEPFDYSNILKDCGEIQVCGLAGDYCVRDTITALAEKYNDKEVVLLAGLTRYAVLPLKSMIVLPIHNYSDNMKKPYINGIISKGNQEIGIGSFISYFKGKAKNKTLYYYLLEIDEGKYHLVQKTTNKNKNLNIDLTNDDFNLVEPGRYFHFITPPETIDEDFKQHKNIKIRLTNNDYIEEKKSNN